MPESGYASESVEFSNKPTSVLELDVSVSNRTPSEVIAGRNGSCKPYNVLNNSRSTAFYNNSTDSQSSGMCMRSVKVTDKKSVCGYNKHCDRPIKPRSRCVNKDATCKVLFPLSNYASKHLEKWDYFNANTVKKLEKTQKPIDWILRQTWIEMHQSVDCNSDQSATPPTPTTNRSLVCAHQPTNQKPLRVSRTLIKAAAAASQSLPLSRRHRTLILSTPTTIRHRT